MSYIHALRSTALRAMNLTDIVMPETQGVMSQHTTARVRHDVPEYNVRAGDVVALAWVRSFRRDDERKGGGLIHEYDVYALAAHGMRFQLTSESLTDYR